MTTDYNVDVFSDAFIQDPLTHYKEMRAAGPVLWLAQHKAFAVARFAEVTEVLRRPDVFASGEGLSMNDDVNALLRGSTLNTDGEDHRRRRAVTARPILPKNIATLEDDIKGKAEALADLLLEKGSFDAVTECAQVLPLDVVRDLVGLNDKGRDKMLTWAAATFNLFEGFNERAQASFKELEGLRDYLAEYGHREALRPGSLAHRIFDIAPEHGFTEAQARHLMRDYIAPSLDTTISAIGFAIWHFAHSPDQWDKLREDPSLLPNAIEEVVRLATPIRAFTRYIREDTEIAGEPLPAGSRIFVFYASANRDEREWDNPDTFDITRNTRKHVGFGHGVHSCMGMHLARMEMRALFGALLARVAKWETCGTPEIAMNNIIRAYAHLPVKVSPL